MGIKFLCPNGHKLHVKSFLAGKRAICPQCGERVIVPAEDASNTTDVGNVSIEISTLPEQLADFPAISVRSQNTAASSAVASSVVPSTAPAAPAAPTTDPIAEAPSAVWYVRPATGGQFGPASGEIMRNWVRDGRVGASSLVWRAGWEEWRSAAEVFPELRGLLTAPLPSAAGGTISPAMPSLPQGVAVAHVAPASPPPASDGSTSPLPQAIRKRRRRNEVSLMTSGVLLAIALILVIVLLLVFQSQMMSSEKSPPAESAAPPAESK